MQAIKSYPETQRSAPADYVVGRSSTTDSSSRADIAVATAILAPLAIVGLLVLVGVSAAVAVCIMFFSVFAATTTLDVRWIRRSRRAADNQRRTRA